MTGFLCHLPLSKFFAEIAKYISNICLYFPVLCTFYRHKISTTFYESLRLEAHTHRCTFNALPCQNQV